jgi:hypothetical protein
MTSPTSHEPHPQDRPEWLVEFDEGNNNQRRQRREWDPTDDCIEGQLMEDLDDFEDCFDGDGDPVCIWPNGGSTPYCSKILVIKADSLATTYGGDRDFIWDFIRYYVRKCPNVEEIKIAGNVVSMNGFYLVTSSGTRYNRFAAFISGINVLKKSPLVVKCFTKLSSRRRSRPRRVRYL